MTFKAPINPRLLERLTVVVGGLILLGIALGGWFPRSCPLLAKALRPCTNVHVSVPRTPEEKELARIPSSRVIASAAFKVTSQNFRETTDVRFYFWPDYANDYAYLQVKKGGKDVDIALITHPLLESVDWGRIGTVDPSFSLYQRNEAFPNVEAFKAALPPKATFAADRVMANLWGLKPEQYTPFEPLLSLEGIDFILTSYIPREPDGQWRIFKQTFNLQDADVVEGQLAFNVLKFAYKENTDAFRIGSVDIDYREIRP